MPASPTQSDLSNASPDRALFNAEALATEHLTHLPKMSPTAGVATQEYVAINGSAIASLILGLASVLSLMYGVFVLLALAGIVMATIALIKIRRSNHTQTGRGLAMMGLFFSVSFGSFVAGSAVMEDYAQSADREQIATLCAQFGQLLNDRRFDDAYDLFSKHFHSTVSRAEFVARLKGEQDELDREVGGNGPVTAVAWNGLINFKIDPDNDIYTADSFIDVHFKTNPNPWSMGASFRKAETKWFIDSIPELFPAEAKKDLKGG